MWFGTRDGLNKYDGYHFTVYKNDPQNSNSISNNFISALEEDAHGIIWIATRGGGLNSYDRYADQFTHYTNDPKNNNSISGNLLDELTKDDNGNLWICTEETGVDFFEPSKNRFTHYRHDPKNEATITDDKTRFVYQDSEKNLWIGGHEGLNFFNKKTNLFTRYRHDKNNSNSISENYVRAIFEDSKKRLWFGTDGGGLDVLDRATGSFSHFTKNAKAGNGISANVVAAIGEDKDGNIWVGTENGGVDILDNETGIFHNYRHDEIDNKSISHNSIYAIYRDSNNDMWVGTYAGGVNIFSRTATLFNHFNHTSFPNSLSNNNILCMAENKAGKIWIGTDGGGLNLFDPATKNFTHFVHDEKNSNSICGDYVLTVMEDSKGNVWMSSWANGITVFNPAKKTYRHFINKPGDSASLGSNDVWTIIEDSEHNIWAGSYEEGLNLYDPATNTFSHFDDRKFTLGKHIYCLAEDGKGNIWIGTDGGGVNVFNKKKRTFVNFSHEAASNSISDNRVNYIYCDSKGNMWINTMSGLNFYDTKSSRFTNYNTVNGLPNNVISGMAEDSNHNFWLSTNRGLSMFNPGSKKFKNFSPADGLQSYEFKAHAVAKSRSGTMYFGGINGFNQFVPEEIKSENLDPVPVFTGFDIFNTRIVIAKNSEDPSPLKQDIAATKEITLSYKQSVISFEFASLNYGDKSKKQYSYKMENFDKDWNYVGSKNTATYTNLDAGKYILKVRSMGSNGEWSAKTAIIQLIITPPFWATWWFKIAVLSAIVLSIFGYIKFRTRSIQLQKIKLVEKVNEQTLQLVQSTKELEQKNKELEQFVYIASHDLQEPLRTTTGFVNLLQKQYKGNLDEKADKYLDFITEASARMKTLIKDLLDYSLIGKSKDFVQVDTDKILQEVVADLGTAITETGAVITAETLPVVTGHPTEIKQLFQNLIINAIKFRKKDFTPEIKITFKNKGDRWQFSIQDNGIGIEAQHKEKIFIIFQRLHSRTDYEGSGIGLAHVKKIVNIHNGDIWIESEFGIGSTFNFTLQK